MDSCSNRYCVSSLYLWLINGKNPARRSYKLKSVYVFLPVRKFLATSIKDGFFFYTVSVTYPVP